MERASIAEFELKHSEEISTSDATARYYQQERIAHWDAVARWMDTHPDLSGGYQRRLAQIYEFFVPRGKRVLELGCAQGDLLASLDPSRGVGVDFSTEMIERARSKHPHLEFVVRDVHQLEAIEEFDVIILSDLVNDLWDVQRTFERLRQIATPGTRINANLYNRLWEWPLRLARKAGLAKPNLPQNWFTVEDVAGLLALADFEVIRHREEILLPLLLWPLSNFANRYLAKIWPFRLFALTHILVARPVLPRDNS